VFKIVWLRDSGQPHDIGGTPMFAPPPVPTIAGDYVVKRIWPQIHEDHPELSGFALLDVPSGDEVFRWRNGHEADRT
jgi:hypothetical protein